MSETQAEEEALIQPAAADMLGALGQGLARRVALSAGVIAAHGSVTLRDLSQAWRQTIMADDRQEALSVRSLAADFWKPRCVPIDADALSWLSRARRAMEIMARKSAERFARARGSRLVTGMDVVPGWHQALEEAVLIADLEDAVHAFAEGMAPLASH